MCLWSLSASVSLSLSFSLSLSLSLSLCTYICTHKHRYRDRDWDEDRDRERERERGKGDRGRKARLSFTEEGEDDNVAGVGDREGFARRDGDRDRHIEPDPKASAKLIAARLEAKVMSQSGGNDAGSKGVPPPVPTFAAKPPVPSFNEGAGGGKRLALTFGGAALDADEASDKVCTKEDAGRGSDAKGFGSTPTCSGVCKHLHLVQGPVSCRGQSFVGLGAPSKSGGVLVLACVGGRVSFHGACNATMSPWGPWCAPLTDLAGC